MAKTTTTTTTTTTTITNTTALTATTASAAPTIAGSPTVLSPGPICDACYRRKSRCAMNESIKKCYSCDFHRQDCTFNYGVKAQQVQAQSQLGKRKFQDELGVGPGTDAEEDEGVKRPATEKPLSPFRRASISDSPSHRHPHSLPTATSIGVAPGSPPEASFATSQHIGMTTELEPLLLDFLTLDHNNESPLATSRVRKFADDGTFMRVIDGFHARHELHTISIENIENAVSPFGPVLIDNFFKHANPAFPVIMEDAFRHSYQTRRNLSPVLLAAVYFISLKWLDQGTAGASVRRGSGSGSGMQTLRKPDAARLEMMATRLLNESLARPHISTVQAGLLLSQKSTLNTPTLITQLVTAGYDLGLHQDCSTWKITSWERGLRKRLAWALYVQDKWCALVHGRPSHIFAANWTVKELTADDFTDIHASRNCNDNDNINDRSDPDISSSAGPGALFFRHFVTLTAILSEILDTFYTLQATSEFSAAGPQRTRIILERAKPIQIRLKQWFTCLPDELRMEHHHQYPLNTNTSRGSSSSHYTSADLMSVDSIINTNTNNSNHSNFNGGLHLAYFATEITLHRTIIRSLGPDSADPYLSHICRSAAKTRLISAMDFVNRLRPAHLRSFWPSASRTNFALISSFGILLRATALTREEEEFYRMRLGEYRWTLSVSCKDAEFLAGAIEGLDVGMCLLRNVPPKRGLDEVVADGYGDGYRGGGGGDGNGNGNENGKGLSTATTIPNADDEINNIVADEAELDVDPELEEEMEQLEAMEEMGEGEDIYSFSSGECSEEYPRQSNQGGRPRGKNGNPRYKQGQFRGQHRYHHNDSHLQGADRSGSTGLFPDNVYTNTDKNSNPRYKQGQYRGHHRYHHNDSHLQGADRSGRTGLFPDNAYTNTDAPPMDIPKLQGAREFASRNLNRRGNSNRNPGQRNRNATVHTNTNTNISAAVGDRRSSSLPSAVSGLASPATSMEGERESGREGAGDGHR
ncbi:hypothetical protein EMPG_11688 [Blastomyces silverae]|uniref:Xylanolytic transcriptional activator regulatory domain-containing protein n=1 Tax=Blastomyces silverae TaxID=2060906 RepID=A0A0H1BQJ6_9EURO|nr:hypothetical protein EMPG_11688 [Blastomyces silverae]